MLSQIQGGTQRVLRNLEIKINKTASPLLRLVSLPVILTLYLVIAVVHSLALLFGTNQDAFLLLYQPKANGEYPTSYIDFTRRKQRIRMISVTSFAITVALSVLVNSLVTNVEPVYAATCNINVDTTVDQNYINTNSCQDIHVVAGSTITFSGDLDLIGSGVFYVDNTVVATFNGALNLTDSNDQVVLNGTVRAPGASTVGVNITTQNLSINGTGSINQAGRGCQGGVVASRNGYGPDTADSDADLDVKECLQGQSGYGKSDRGGAAHAGIGGRQSLSDTSQSVTYGNDRAPVLNGAGGAAGANTGENGGSGGGIIRLNVPGTLSVNGQITANGSNAAANAGGGAGGSVHITAGTLTGSSTITANGGNGLGSGGGGGGGRVAVYFDNLNAFVFSSITAQKGLRGPTGSSTDGGAGATFILNRRIDDGLGDLRITSGLDFQNGGDYERNNVIIDNGSNLTCAIGLASLTLGGTNTLMMNGTTFTCATPDSVTFRANNWVTSNTNTINISKAGATTTWDINSDLTLNNTSFTGPNAGTSSANGGLLNMDEAIAVSLVGSNINASVNWLNLTSLNINNTSSINASGKGCPGGPGNTTGTALDGYGLNGSLICTQSAGGYGKNIRGGASHGGSGGNTNGVANSQTTIYGSDAMPTTFGSGGAGGPNTNETGGAGGGRIRIDTTGTLTLNGSLSAAGANANTNAGAGAGGSIYVTAGTLAGSSAMTANGGNGAGFGGGAGGGRIAVYYDVLSGYSLSSISAPGGIKGPSGTPGNGSGGSTFILNRRSDDGAGDLRITTGLDFQSTGDYTRTNITIDNGAALSCNGSFATLNLAATNTLTTNGMTMTCSSVDTLNFAVGTWTMSNTNSMSFDKPGSVANWDITNDLTLSNFTYNGGNAGSTSQDGGLLTLDKRINLTLSNNSSLNTSARIVNVKNITIDGTSKIAANGKGCFGGQIGVGTAADGYGPNTSTGICALSTSGYGKGQRGGAAYGGTGGRSGLVANGQTVTYGSNTTPDLMGSSGGSGANAGEIGGNGGGKIRLIVAGTLTVHGSIFANGGNALANAGGGSGGSLYITTGILAGGGSISAVGGNGLGSGGGGGGGRAAVEYGSLNAFNLSNISAGGGAAGPSGSTQPGGAGSTFNKTLSVPTTPSITAPINNATGQSRTLSVTSSTYASDGAFHTSSDWQISDDNTFSDNDCGSGHVVFCSMTSSNLENIAVSASNGTFQSALNGRSALAPNKTYYVRVRHKNGAGNSAWSSSVAFTTVANNAPGTPTNTTPTDGATSVSKNPTLTASAFSDLDGDSHFISDWALYETNNCSGTPDWLVNGSNNLTSIVVNDTNGTFADALAGRTSLKAHTVYSFKVSYSDGFSPSVFSSCTSFTTLNNAPASGGTIPDQTFNEDGSVTNAFNLNTYLTDPDFNDNGNLNCSATNGFTAGLGTMTVNANGAVDFSLANNANGSDTVQFSCQDGDGLSVASNVVTVTVTAVNDAPSFTKGANQTVNEDAGAQTVNAWATSISKGASDESGQTLTFNVNNDNTGLFSSQPSVDVANGNLTYTPAANVSGVATVTINLSDNGGTANGGSNTSADQTFTITVNSVNDAPSFTKGADQTVLEDVGSQTVLGWATGMSKGPSDESGQTLSFNVTATNTNLFSVQPAVAANGTLTYTPAANANGTTAVNVTIVDDGGTTNGGVNTSAPQSFNITITAVNDAPSFTKGSDQTVNEDAGAQTVNGWATAVSAGPANESAQALSFEVSTDNDALFSALPAVNATTGALSFTPAANANGSATVTLAIHDDGGTTNGGVDTSADQTFTITVNSVNDIPSYTKGPDVTVAEDSGAKSISHWATAISSGPSDESGQTVSFILSNNNNGLFSSQPALTNSGTLSFTPAANASGSATVSIVAKDNGGTSNGGNDTAAVKSFTVTVTSVNDAPTLSIVPDQTVNEGDTIIIDLSATDRENDPVTFNVADTNGDFSDRGIDINTLFVDHGNDTATFTWSPDSQLVGDYVLTFTANDGAATSSDAVTITVDDSDGNPVFSGQLPVVSILAGETTENVFDLDDYFTDPEGQTLTYTSSSPQYVTLTINTDHQVTIEAPANLSATDEVTFTATDPLGQSTNSNLLEIVINASDGDDGEIGLAQISHVNGRTTGPGTVMVIGQNGQILSDWVAYPVGGVIPRIGLAGGDIFIYTVKHRSGTTMSVYDVNGTLQRKKRISPQVHWRKLAVGNLRGSSNDHEIVTSTRRDHKLYFKVYSYHSRTRTMKLEKRTVFGPMNSNDYSTTISQKAVHIVNKNGKTVFDWKAF